MVVVNHGKTLSNLYTSAKITPYVVEFSLSLERVMYYNPERTWRDSWLSNSAGDASFVDVYKVCVRLLYTRVANDHDQIF